MGFESIWEAEEDRWLKRSVPAHPDPSPETTARAYQNLRARRAEQAIEVDESEYDLQITMPAEEFDEPISALQRYVTLALKSGWELVELGHSKAFAKGKPFKTGANEGQSRPDENIEQQWMYAQKADVGRVAVSYTIVNDKARGNLTARRHNGRALSDAELRAVLKGEA